MQTSSPDTPRPGRRPVRFRPRLSNESGAAIVEFALILPFVCLIIAMILDFGRAFNYWVDTTHLASEGARLAAVDRVPPADPTCSSTTLQIYIRCKADTAELRDGGSRWIDSPLEVCVNPGPGDAVGDPVEVTVTTTYDWLPILGLAQTEIRGSATMRREVVADNVSSGCG